MNFQSFMSDISTRFPCVNDYSINWLMSSEHFGDIELVHQVMEGPIFYNIYRIEDMYVRVEMEDYWEDIKYSFYEVRLVGYKSIPIFEDV